MNLYFRYTTNEVVKTGYFGLGFNEAILDGKHFTVLGLIPEWNYLILVRHGLVQHMNISGLDFAEGLLPQLYIYYDQ